MRMSKLQLRNDFSQIGAIFFSISPIYMRSKYDINEIMADPILEISSHENRNF